MRDNGAIEGGAAAFAEDDEVVILRKFDDSKIYVVAHKDGIKSCFFRFKLTRGDGAVLTDAEEYDVSFTVKRSTGDVVSINPSYSSESGYWTLAWSSGHVIDPNGYWVSYSCNSGISTQYPYIYKTASKGQSADLIHPGSYEDTIPYWAETLSMSTGARTWKIIFSSIPYRITHLERPSIMFNAVDTENVGYIAIEIFTVTEEGLVSGSLRVQYNNNDVTYDETEDIPLYVDLGDFGANLSGTEIFYEYVSSENHVTYTRGDAAGFKGGDPDDLANWDFIHYWETRTTYAPVVIDPYPTDLDFTVEFL